jgi:hypothetical protein
VIPSHLGVANEESGTTHMPVAKQIIDKPLVQGHVAGLTAVQFRRAPGFPISGSACGSGLLKATLI